VINAATQHIVFIDFFRTVPVAAKPPHLRQEERDHDPKRLWRARIAESEGDSRRRRQPPLHHSRRGASGRTATPRAAGRTLLWTAGLLGPGRQLDWRGRQIRSLDGAPAAKIVGNIRAQTHGYKL